VSVLVWLFAGLSAGLGEEVSFRRLEIDARPPQNPWIKIVADLDGDGRKDVIIGGAKGPLAWYANPLWKKAVLAEGGYDSVDGEAADLDGDGDLDLVLGGVVWYENPRPVGDPAQGPWPVHRIGRHRTHDVEVGDLDQDGKPDVVVRGQTGFGHREGHRFFLWKQLALDRWASREVACPEGEGLKLADLDGDGDLDVVIAARWYENTGDLLGGRWAEHVYAPEWKHGDCKVDVGDFNRDGRLDVVLSPAEFAGGSHRVSWFEAPADRKGGRWREHVVEQSVEAVLHALGVADLDGDGAPDFVTARMHQGRPPQEVCVYLNRSSGAKWARQVVSVKGSHNIILADLDGDGATDILGANHGGPYQPVEWWKNALPRKAPSKPGPDCSP
jgi:hypothetical protein